MKGNPLRHGERGSILIMTAVVLSMMLGITALAIDAAYMYDVRNRMGAAADSAALAAAQELKRGGTGPNLYTYANYEIAMHGFNPGDGSMTVTVNSPPTSGTFAGVSRYVEVIVSRPMSTFFAKTLGISSMTVGGRAVAGPGDSSGCVYALNSADPKYPIELNVNGSSGTVINVPNCGIVSNGNFAVSAGNTITAKEIDVHASSGTISGTVSPPPNYSTPVADDPFSDLNETALFGSSFPCTLANTKVSLSGSTSYTLNPGNYCGDSSNKAIKIGLMNDPAYTVHFNPGLYVINGGGLDWKHSYVNGTGVTFYLTGTSATYVACGGKIFDTDAPLNLQLSAPTSGTYEGMLFIQDRTQATACSANPVLANLVPADMTINGSIYFPNHHIIYGATTTSTGLYTVLIGGTIEFKNKATLNSDFKGAGLSGSPIKKATSAE